MRIFDHLLVDSRIKRYMKEGEAYYWAEFPAGGKVDVWLRDNHVSDIQLNYPGRSQFRVHQVIERLGEPEAYATYSNIARPKNDQPCERWDDRVYRDSTSPGYLLYPSQGVTVLVEIATGYTGCLCPDMKIALLIYYQPVSLDEVIEQGRSPAFNMFDWNREDLVPWHGFGCGY